MKMETIREALAEYLMSIPFNEILEELVELKEDIDYERTY